MRGSIRSSRCSSRSSARTSRSATRASTRGSTRGWRSPGRSPVGSPPPCASGSRLAMDSDLLRALAYTAFLLNLINLAPIGFLDGGHVLQLVAGPPRRGRGDQPVAGTPAGERRRGALARDRRGPRARDGRRARAAGSGVSESTELDRQLLRRSRDDTLASDVSLIASEFLAGFQAVQEIGGPAVSIFGSARVVEGSPTYESGARDGAALRRGRARRRDGRRARRDGGGEPRRARRAAASRSGSTSSSRTSRARTRTATSR